MWCRGRQRDYRVLGEESGASPRPRSQVAVRLLVVAIVLGSVCVLVSVLLPRRPAVQYACTKITGVHLDRRHYPYIYISFVTFARIENLNFFPVAVEKMEFHLYHWDDEIGQSALEPRNFPARTRIVEAIRTNATGFTKSALEHLYEDTQDGVVMIELRGSMQVRSFARDWRYRVRSQFVHINVTEWSSRPSSDEPCPPPDYTGPQ